MNALTQLPTSDPRMRAYRLVGTAAERPSTIHDIIRRQATDGRGAAGTGRVGQVALPWIATR